MSTVKIDAGSGLFLWDWMNGRNQVGGYSAVDSNQLPKTTAVRGSRPAGDHETDFFFSGSQVLFGTWGTDDTLLDPYTLRSHGYVRLSCIAHHDIQLRYPESVVQRQYMNNVKTG